MFKPKIISPVLGHGFAEQEKQVSISTDWFDYTDDSPFKVFLQLEPNEIVPTEKELINNHAFYDLIITWNENVFLACPNAVKYVFGTCRWSTNPQDHCDVSQKRFEVSYLTSSKTMCPGHLFRHDIFRALPDRVGSIAVTKHMSPPEIPDKKTMLYPFQFSIVMENVKRKNWITEKLIDCLVSRTVPIYHGAPNVAEWFDDRGILSFNTHQELIGILEGLNPNSYNERLNAIEYNLHEAMKYTDLHSRVDEAIRRRLSGDYSRVPEYLRSRQKLRDRLSQSQSTFPRNIHR